MSKPTEAPPYFLYGHDFLFLDFESASEVDITVIGTENYVSHPSTRPLMLSYSLNKSPVALWESGESFPLWLRATILRKDILKVAFNVAFERGILKHCLKIDTPIEQWWDARTCSRYLSVPGTLAETCKRMDLPPEFQKMATEGKEGIRLFSSPIKKKGKPGLWGPEPFFNSKENKPKEWEDFTRYCKQDTEVERKIFYDCLPYFPPQSEVDLYRLDQKINARGLPVDVDFVRNALSMALRSRENVFAILKELTGLENPNSNTQMLEWLRGQKYPFTSLNKDVVKVALKTPGEMTELAQEVLLVSKEFKRSSYTKLEAILDRVSADGRIRDCFSFMGATRTLRWAGQDIQFQNLSRPDKAVEKSFDRAMELVQTNDFEKACEEFGVTIEWCGKKRKIQSCLGMVISCLRSVFKAKKGRILIVCDLSAIENRVLAWLAGCEPLLDVFREGLDPYKSFATMMYLVEYDDVTGEMRTIAKPAVLGCGYGLGPGVIRNKNGSYTIQWKCSKCHKKFRDTFHACVDEKGNRKGDLQKTGLMGYAEKMGVILTPEQAYKAWETFRRYKEIPRLWRILEKGAIRAIKSGKKVRVRFVEFDMVEKDGKPVMRIKLPSGRHIHYLNARIEAVGEKWGGTWRVKNTILYDGIGHGVGATSVGAKWGTVKTYGGKLAENIVQAISRDILAHGMTLADYLGLTIVGHVHDEIICEEEEREDRFGIHDLRYCMQTVPSWAPGLPLGAEGWEGYVYKKS